MPIRLPAEMSIDVYYCLDKATREVLSLTSAGYNSIYRTHLQQYSPNLCGQMLTIQFREAHINIYLRMEKGTDVPHYFSEFESYERQECTEFYFELKAADLLELVDGRRWNIRLRVLGNRRITFDSSDIIVLAEYALSVPYHALLYGWRHFWMSTSTYSSLFLGSYLYLCTHGNQLNENYTKVLSTLSDAKGAVYIANRDLPNASSEELFHNAYEYLRVTSAAKRGNYRLGFEISFKADKEHSVILSHARAFAQKANKVGCYPTIAQLFSYLLASIQMFVSQPTIAKWNFDIKWAFPTSPEAESGQASILHKFKKRIVKKRVVKNPTTKQELLCQETTDSIYNMFHFRLRTL